MKLYFTSRPAAALFCAALTLFSLGCAQSIVVKQDDVLFKDRTDKLALRLGLYIEDAQRHWVYSYRKLGMGYDFALGQALEASAPKALQQSFKDVTALTAKDGEGADVDRVMTIQFGPATRFDFGLTTMSSNHAVVELVCEISDKNGKVLWSGSAEGSVDRSAGSSGLIHGFMGSWLKQAYAQIYNDALTAALEKLTDQILTDARPRIAG